MIEKSVPAYLQLAARSARAPHLADAITAQGLPLSWTTDWASWRLQHPHRTFTGHTGPVNSVALGQVEGRAVVVSGSDDRTVRVWDAATGTPISDTRAKTRNLSPCPAPSTCPQTCTDSSLHPLRLRDS